ncbi:host specificity factor TipJ family phage tail protein [Bosea sp. AS-1]|uniref:host specificity factor TipJ family phage tail protein n=1 Tax=Bosea sp. AS-1 TaxID=2015316 RepID=UPI000B7812FA|nr:host specificity factor TipJ family phage tail protein [Bosea sp. AS-1]
MADILFRRCDGLEAGERIVLSKGRRLLSAVVKAHADKSRPFIVSLCRRKRADSAADVSICLRKTWSRTSVRKHDTVVIVYLPMGGGGASGGGGGGSKGASIGLVVAAIALVAVGQFWGIAALNGALGLAATSSVGGVIWAAGTTALLAGASYLLSKATKAKADDTDNRPVYGVAGGGNQPRSGDRIPVIYGKCWNAPDLSQPDYTTYDGDDQVLYKRMTLGCGKYAVKAIRVSGVTMWTATGGLTPPFTGAAVEVISPGGVSSLVPGSVVSVQAVSNNQIPKAADFPNYAGPFDFGADAPLQTRIQLDYSLASGCYAIPQSGKFEGKQYPTDWGVIFEYAPCDEDGTPTGAFTTLYADGGNTLSTRPMRFTRLVDVPSGRYTVRARNIGAADTVSHPSGFDAEVTNAIVWEGLRSHNAETITRPGVTELAMRIRSGKQLGVTTYGDVEVLTSRVLPVWYGGTTGWVEEETDKAVWAAVDVLRNTDYGAAIDDGLLDLDRFKFYSDNLSEYDRFSAIIRGPVSVYEAATTVLGVMRASPLRLGSIWTLVRDEPKAVRKHVISRRQILTDSSGQTFNLDINDGSADVIVEWYADGDPKRRREKRVTFGTQTLTPKRMSATGVTDGAHAIHIATWAAATAYYRRERRSLTTELAGRLFLPNDSAAIDNWYFDATYAAGVQDRDGLVLAVDSEMELPASPYAILRARDGREWGPVAVTLVGDQLTLDATDVAQAEALSGLSLDEVLGTQTQALTTVVVGTLTEVQDAWLIRAVSFSGDTQVGVEAVYDAPQVWSALDEPIVVPPPPPSSGLENDASVTVSYVRAKAVQRNGAMFMDWAVGRSTGATQYAVRISYDDWATSEDVYRGPNSSGTHPLRETSGTIRIRARGISGTGYLGPEVENAFSVAPAVLDLGNATPGSLQYQAFFEGLEPVGLVTDLPDLFGYQGPKVVALKNATTGNKLVLYNLNAAGTAWEPAAAADYVANSITAAAVQAGAITATAMNVDELSAITANMGYVTAGAMDINGRFSVAADGTVTIKNAATGARLVITNTLLQVYDASNVLRVRLGIW